jgi:uncharacterized membrane protein
MAIKNLSVGDIVNQSWDIVKKNVWIFAGVFLVLVLVELFFNMLFGIGGVGAAAAVNPGNTAEILAAMFGASFLLYFLVSIIVQAIFYLGYLKMALIAADGGEPTLSAFAISARKVINVIIAYFLFEILMVIGLILCIVPGIIVASRLYFFFFFIIDEDCGPIEALSKSWEATKGETWNIVLLLLAFLLVNIVGAICCGVGLLVTVPMSYIGFAIVYRKLVVQAPAGDFESLADTDNI